MVAVQTNCNLSLVDNRFELNTGKRPRDLRTQKLARFTANLEPYLESYRVKRWAAVRNEIQKVMTRAVACGLQIEDITPQA